MPPRRRVPHLVAGALVAALLAAGCASDDGEVADAIELDGDRPGQPDATGGDGDAGEAGEAGGERSEGGDAEDRGDEPGEDPDTGDALEADQAPAAGGDRDDPSGPADATAGDGASDAGQPGPGLAALAADGVADLAVARPGTWPVGDAGTVSFELDGRDLVLRGIDAATGWNAEVERDRRDRIEVAFHREQVRWRFRAERSGRHLEVRIDQRIDGAPTGGYDLGDAGTFAFDLHDGRLVLSSLEVADGWSVRDRDVDDDEIELELRADDRRVDVEVDRRRRGEIELSIAYRVRTRVR